jgi:hypothetical protein
VEGYELLAVAGLMFVCVAIQALILTTVQRRSGELVALWQTHRSFGAQILMVYAVILIVVLIHLLQAGVWAAFFHWVVGIRPWHDAYYHSILSLTTMDDSSGVLPERWRLLGAAEGLLGWIVFSWSTAAIFMFLTSLRDRAEQGEGH